MTLSGKANVSLRKNRNRALWLRENSCTDKLHQTAHQIQSHSLFTSFLSISLMPFTLPAHGAPRLNSNVWLSRSPTLWLFPGYSLMKTLSFLVRDAHFHMHAFLHADVQNMFDPHLFFLKSQSVPDCSRLYLLPPSTCQLPYNKNNKINCLKITLYSFLV